MPLRTPLRRARVLAPVLLAVLLLTGCAQLQDTVELATALDGAGVRDPEIRTMTTAGIGDVATGTTVTVTYASDEISDQGVALEAGRVQSIVWRTFPTRFDRLVLQISAPQTRSHGGTVTTDRAALQASLGARPAGMDNDPSRGLVSGIVLIWLAVAVLVVLALAAGAAVARRERRRQLLGSITSTPGYRAQHGGSAYVPPGGMRSGSAWISGPRS
jgi:hypothetical protein